MNFERADLREYGPSALVVLVADKKHLWERRESDKFRALLEDCFLFTDAQWETLLTFVTSETKSA